MPGRIVRDFARPAHLHLPSAPRREVAGRRALHRRGREVYLRPSAGPEGRCRASSAVYFTTIKSCEVLDPYTVRFTATERYFKTLEMLGDAADHSRSTSSKRASPTSTNIAFGRAPIGTGPYKFVRWDTGSQIVLERNDDYWGRAAPLSQAARLPDHPGTLRRGATAEERRDRRRRRHAADSMGARTGPQPLDEPSLTKIVYAYPAYNYLGFNLRLPLFSDIRVRHAIDLLIPRDEILPQIYLNQYASETSGYDPPSSPNYNHDVPPTPYDPAAGPAALDARPAGKTNTGDGILYKDGQPLSFTLLYPAETPTTEKIAELIQESLRRAGIDSSSQRLEFVQLIERARRLEIRGDDRGLGARHQRRSVPALAQFAGRPQEKLQLHRLQKSGGRQAHRRRPPRIRRRQAGGDLPPAPPDHPRRLSGLLSLQSRRRSCSSPTAFRTCGCSRRVPASTSRPGGCPLALQKYR